MKNKREVEMERCLKLIASFNEEEMITARFFLEKIVDGLK